MIKRAANVCHTAVLVWFSCKGSACTRSDGGLWGVLEGQFFICCCFLFLYYSKPEWKGKRGRMTGFPLTSGPQEMTCTRDLLRKGEEMLTPQWELKWHCHSLMPSLFPRTRHWSGLVYLISKSGDLHSAVCLKTEGSIFLYGVCI